MPKELILKAEAVKALDEYVQHVIWDEESPKKAEAALECLRIVKNIRAFTLCKVCKHKKEENGVLRCPYSTVDLEPDGFCHRGEIG